MRRSGSKGRGGIIEGSEKTGISLRERRLVDIRGSDQVC